MNEDAVPAWKRLRTWVMTVGLVVAIGCTAYCVYGVWHGLGVFAGFSLAARMPIGLALGALTFLGASVATVWCANGLARLR